MFELIRSLRIQGEAATGVAEVPADHPMLADHFPGRALLPGTWLVELAAQIAGPLCESLAPGRWAVLAMIQHAKLLAPVELPATLRFEATITRREAALVGARASAHREDIAVLRAELVFALVDATPELEAAIRQRHERVARWKAAP